MYEATCLMLDYAAATNPVEQNKDMNDVSKITHKKKHKANQIRTANQHQSINPNISLT